MIVKGGARLFEKPGIQKMKKFAPKSADERKAELQEIMGKLEEGVKNVFTSENFLNYLRVSSMFHRYSLNNQILIWAQCPNATAVASFSDWKNKAHRYVKAGQKGIRILAPMPISVKEKAEDGVTDMSAEEKKILLFKTVCVFDISQTVGEPLPTVNISELDGDVENFDEMFEAVCQCTTASVTYDEVSGEAKGFYRPTDHSITLRNGMPQQQTLKTLLHEVTHSILHGAKSSTKDRDTKEVEAEGTAFVVASALGLDTSSYSFPYIGTWSSNKELPELKASLEVIQKTSKLLIDKIEESLGKTAKEDVA